LRCQPEWRSTWVLLLFLPFAFCLQPAVFGLLSSVVIHLFCATFRLFYGLCGLLFSRTYTRADAALT
jgi:hypothetical protein